LKVQCKICKKHTCFKCKEKWEMNHEGKTCEELEAHNASNGADLISRRNSYFKLLINNFLIKAVPNATKNTF
jgi:hypothetical protein